MEILPAARLHERHGYPATTISFRQGEIEKHGYQFETQIFMGHLHVVIGPITVMFYDVQEGLDIINSLATVPPVDIELNGKANQATPTPTPTPTDEKISEKAMRLADGSVENQEGAGNAKYPPLVDGTGAVSTYPVCDECSDLNDDNPGSLLCKTCEVWNLANPVSDVRAYDFYKTSAYDNVDPF